MVPESSLNDSESRSTRSSSSKLLPSAVEWLSIILVGGLAAYLVSRSWLTIPMGQLETSSRSSPFEPSRVYSANQQRDIQLGKDGSAFAVPLGEESADSINSGRSRTSNRSAVAAAYPQDLPGPSLQTSLAELMDALESQAAVTASNTSFRRSGSTLSVSIEMESRANLPSLWKRLDDQGTVLVNPDTRFWLSEYSSQTGADSPSVTTSNQRPFCVFFQSRTADRSRWTIYGVNRKRQLFVATTSEQASSFSHAIEILRDADNPR